MSTPRTQVEGGLSAIEESAQASPTPLEGKEASAEQSVESSEASPQTSMATLTQEDTRPKVLIRGEWRKVPDGYPADASGWLECDQLFINDLSKQLVAKLHAARQFNPDPGARPKSSDTKRTGSTSVHFVTTCRRCMFCGLYFSPLVWCTNG